MASTVLVLTTTRAKHQSTVRIARGSHAIYLAGFPRQFLGKEPLAQIFIRHDCRNFWLLDPAELLEQSGRQTLLLTQNTRALKGMAPLLQRHGFNDTCNNFRPHQNGKPPARCPRLFLSPSLLHKAFEPCKIVCVAWLKSRREDVIPGGT